MIENMCKLLQRAVAIAAAALVIMQASLTVVLLQRITASMYIRKAAEGAVRT
jgi:hypothetical protein